MERSDNPVAASRTGIFSREASHLGAALRLISGAWTKTTSLVIKLQEEDHHFATAIFALQLIHFQVWNL
ncbi:MAG TPA: hypothetical protein VF490_19865 [Chryseosolibacter sp.]